MSEDASPLDLQALRGIFKKAAFALMSRTVALDLIWLGGTLALARLLDPRDFGVFAILQFALGLLVFLGDTGVGGALVRQKEEPGERQLSSMFHFQLIASTLLLLIVLAAAGALPYLWPDLPPSAPLLMRVLAFDFLLVCLRVVPFLLMERQLDFAKIALVEVVGTLSFFAIAVLLAALGAGVWALVAGLLGQRLLTTLAVYFLSPWRPKAIFDWTVLRPLLRFGFTQQLRNVEALINSAVVPVWGGRVLGTTTVGYITWAQDTAYFPLKMVVLLARIGFPLFGRLQHDRALLGEALGRSIQLSALVTLLWVGLCLGLGHHLTLVVFGAKWLPAEPMLIVFAAAISIGFLSQIVAVAYDAIGKPGTFVRIAAGWTTANWIIVPITTSFWNDLGFVAGYAVHVVVGNVVLAVLTEREFPGVKIWQRMRAPLAGAIAVVALGQLLLSPSISGGVQFGLAVVASVLVFFAVVGLLEGRGILRALSVVPGALDDGSDAVRRGAA